ncbi:hypothetical protein ALC57_01628 [Trachymyrmex cornetzi]|uniref:Uncharacterized protein n=1 Tax=Trachymyrmex cornetzi TaxID=471704 RepID=A0A195ELH6_9HYME|nr:hypothetical protein ALC57_01628 [Trachymyrmex cornetzi]
MDMDGGSPDPNFVVITTRVRQEAGFDSEATNERTVHASSSPEGLILSSVIVTGQRHLCEEQTYLAQQAIHQIAPLDEVGFHKTTRTASPPLAMHTVAAGSSPVVRTEEWINSELLPPP